MNFNFNQSNNNNQNKAPGSDPFSNIPSPQSNMFGGVLNNATNNTNQPRVGTDNGFNNSGASSPFNNISSFGGGVPATPADPFKASFGNNNTTPTADPFKASFDNTTADPFKANFGNNNTTPTADPFKASFDNTTADPFKANFGNNNTTPTADPFKASFDNTTADPFKASFDNNKSNDPFKANFGDNNETFSENKATLDLGTSFDGLNQEYVGEVNKSTLVSSIKESTTNLYNLSVKEIIDRETDLLNENIQNFKKEAKKIFDQDMRLIGAKCNYVKVQEKIDNENLKLDELIGGLNFFEKELEKKLKEVSHLKNEDFSKYDRSNNNNNKEVNSVKNIINTYEKISDEFLSKIETFKDENAGVMDILNQNYELIDKIDNKIDMLEKNKSLF